MPKKPKDQRKIVLVAKYIDFTKNASHFDILGHKMYSWRGRRKKA
jgi:hypothetical protein